MTKPLYFYNGTTFEQVGPTTPQSPIAYQTSAPTGPATGDLWIDSDGDVDTYNRQLTRYYFVATAAQTTITGTDANGLTLAYVAGSEAVYVNGALQVRGQDYTATNGTSVVMTAALAVNDVVEIFAYTAFTVANAYTKSETDGLVGAAAGLKLIVPTSVAVGSGTSSISTNGQVTFTGASSVSLNGVFTSAYRNYRVLIESAGASASGAYTIRFRTSGSDVSSANYQVQELYGSASTAAAGRGANGTSWNNSNVYTEKTCMVLDLFSPQVTTSTSVFSTCLSNSTSTTPEITFKTIGFNATNQFDGISWISSGANMTGTVSVFGYRN